MRKLLIFLSLIILSGCAHVRQTCDTYCFSRGGTCDHVDQGWTRYNTATGSTQERPTEFVCRYNW